MMRRNMGNACKRIKDAKKRTKASLAEDKLEK